MKLHSIEELKALGFHRKDVAAFLQSEDSAAYVVPWMLELYVDSTGILHWFLRLSASTHSKPMGTASMRINKVKDRVVCHLSTDPDRETIVDPCDRVPDQNTHIPVEVFA